MSQSMLLSKPSYSYGATKNNYSESHEEYNNQWAGNVKQSNFNYQAHDNQMGHGSSNRGTNYYAQAQCAQPTPTINMVQTVHVESMNRQESIKGHNSAHVGSHSAHASQFGLSSPTIGKQQRVIIHEEEEHVVEKVESSVVNKPTSFSGPARANQFGVQAEAYNYSEGGVEKSWASNPIKNTMYNKHGQGLNMYKDEHVMEKSDLIVINPSTHSPELSRENQYGQAMYGDHGANHGLAGHPTKYSGPNQLGHLGNNMYKEQGMAHKSSYGLAQNGLGASHVSYSDDGLGQNGFGSGHAKHSDYSAGQVGFGSSQANYSANGVGQHGFGQSRDHSDHGVGQHGFGPSRDNHSSYGVGQHGFVPSRDNHSTHGVGHHGFGQSQVNHSDYGAAQNHLVAHNGHYSANGMAKNGFRSGQVNHSGYGVAQNGFGAPNANYSANGVGQKRFEAAQTHHSAYGATQNNFGAPNAKNGFGSHAYHDHHEADEEVYEIMDEILAKYPAHNVSNGPGSNWATKPNGYVSENQGASYVKQHSFSGQAQNGMAVQSSSNKFQMKNEMKKEFSHSSSSNNFEMNNRGKNGGSPAMTLASFA